MLKLLYELFAVTSIERNMGAFSGHGYMTSEQVGLVRSKVHALLAAIRPEAVALVDSFALSDNQLNSALGRYDGE